MTDESHPDPAPGEARPEGGKTYHEEVQHAPATARIPDAVGRGVFSTHAIVMQGAHEFMIDFIQSLALPRRVVARIILPISVAPLFVAALDDNLRKYAQSFGPPPRMLGAPPGMQPPAPPPIAEVYEQLKLPDEMLGGTYANTVVISHSQAEFCLDFICNFFPRSVVASRVYLAAPHVPEVFDSLKRCLEQYHLRLTQPRGGMPPQSEPHLPHPEGNHNDPDRPDTDG